MMRSKQNILILSALFVFAFPKLSRSQDTAKVECGDIITFKNETTQKAKILEITPTEVVFKRCANPNGPTIRISKNNIASVVYLNGMKETFAGKYTNEEVQHSESFPEATMAVTPINLATMKAGEFDTIYPQPKIYSYDRTRHFISLDVFSCIFYQMPSVSYECIYGKGKFGTRAHFDLGTLYHKKRDREIYFRQWTKQSVGLDFNYYLFEGNFHPGPVKCFVGPSIEYGVFSYTSYDLITIHDSIFTGSPPVFSHMSTEYQTKTYFREGYHTTIMLKGGFLCRPAKHFNISLTSALGRMKFNKGYHHTDRLMMRLEVNMGFKF